MHSARPLQRRPAYRAWHDARPQPPPATQPSSRKKDSGLTGLTGLTAGLTAGLTGLTGLTGLPRASQPGLLVGPDPRPEAFPLLSWGAEELRHIASRAGGAHMTDRLVVQARRHVGDGKRPARGLARQRLTPGKWPQTPNRHQRPPAITRNHRQSPASPVGLLAVGGLREVLVRGRLPVLPRKSAPSSPPTSPRAINLGAGRGVGRSASSCSSPGMPRGTCSTACQLAAPRLTGNWEPLGLREPLKAVACCGTCQSCQSCHTTRGSPPSLATLAASTPPARTPPARTPPARTPPRQVPGGLRGASSRGARRNLQVVGQEQRRQREAGRQPHLR